MKNGNKELPGIIIETHMMAYWKGGVMLNPAIPYM